MHWILEFIVKHRNFCSLILTSMLSLWMISGTKQQQAQTAKLLTVSIFYPLQATIGQITTINNIFAENRRLRSEVVQLNTQLAKLQEQAAENERLIGLLNFSKEFSYDMVPVRVIARDPSTLYRSIVVNAGRSEGIQVWMPLVAEKGVVGKVTQVMEHMSLVQLLRDPINRTSVMTRRSRSVGILETENGTDFFIRVRSHEDVNKGDTVITSGLGGVYPRGINVGIVQRISDSNDPLFKKVWLKLTVDFEHIEELFVLKLSPQWSAFHAEFDSLELKK
jgi:rod shape-determining protein MreC